MQKIKLLSLVILAISLNLSVSACVGDKAKSKAIKSEQVITVKSEARTKSLYFSGTISPIKVVAVTSPVAGTVDAMYFNYGGKIKKGEVLLQIYSAELDKKYQDVVSAYLTAKEKYTTNKSDIVGSKNLHTAGIISDQDYQGKMSSLNNSYLSLLQAEHNLFALLKKLKIGRGKIELLKIGDPKAVRLALTEKIGKIKVPAKADGIALKPTKAASTSTSDDDSEGKAIQVGSQIKEGQLLVALGNMSGISIDVNVGEIHIGQIKVGEKATVTGSAFPATILHGAVSRISSQANDAEGSGPPTFPITIEIKNLTAHQQKIIHVGMSAKIELTTQEPKGILIPIKAVFQKNGASFVRVKNAKTGKVEEVAVKTSETTLDKVEIFSGLKEGDQIVVSH